jgi:hypothetical protein
MYTYINAYVPPLPRKGSLQRAHTPYNPNLTVIYLTEPIYAYGFVNTYIGIYAYMYVYIYTCMYMYNYTHICIYMYTHSYIHMDIYIHTHLPLVLRLDKS